MRLYMGNLATTALRNDTEDLPTKDCRAAEARYAKELERQLDSPGLVAAAMGTMHSAGWKSRHPR